MVNLALGNYIRVFRKTILEDYLRRVFKRYLGTLSSPLGSVSGKPFRRRSRNKGSRGSRGKYGTF
jgi:hypothetical protein